MSATTFDTVRLNDCLDGIQAGDRAAADALLRGTGARLEKLAKRMIRSFPNVRAHADTADVYQSSMIRLLRSLRTMRPATTRDFYNLAAVHIRRELLDLARRSKGRAAVVLAPPADGGPEPVQEPAADFDFWVRFHQAVDMLPTEEREVVGLVFYHGWKQAQIAELFGVDERTVRRRWHRACESLRRLLGDDAI